MYHITKSKSKVKPFSVLLVAENGEPLSSHPLKTKVACFKNIQAQLKQVHDGKYSGGDRDELYVYAQDDTLKNSPMVHIVYKNEHYIVDDMPVKPRYVPGKNPKKKK